jgi:hypothetical protein
MFCAGCGTQIQPGLNYCSRCGRRVAEDAKAGVGHNPRLIAAYTTGVGFVSYIIVVRLLSKGGLPPDIFLPITFFYFAALFGICFLILRQPQAAARNDKASELPVSKEQPQFRPVITAQLNEGFHEPASVTDHTTRTLDKMPARKS